MARIHADSTPASGYIILVVDDQPEILAATKAFLEHVGHTVLTAASGEQALDLFRPGQIDLLIVDYFMPRMTGEELVGQIRKIDEDVQVLLQTGYSGEKPPIEMLRTLDIQGYHDKTEGPDSLAILVEASLKAAMHLKAVRATERPKTDRVANVSQELCAPLSVILDSSEMLLEPDSALSPSQNLEGLTCIYKQACSMADLVHNFLNSAKVQVGRLSP